MGFNATILNQNEIIHNGCLTKEELVIVETFFSPFAYKKNTNQCCNLLSVISPNLDWYIQNQINHGDSIQGTLGFEFYIIEKDLIPDNIDEKKRIMLALKKFWELVLTKTIIPAEGWNCQNVWKLNKN